MIYDILFVVPTGTFSVMWQKKYDKDRKRFLFVPTGGAVCGICTKMIIVHADWLAWYEKEEDKDKMRQWFKTSMLCRRTSRTDPVIFLGPDIIDTENY